MWEHTGVVGNSACLAGRIKITSNGSWCIGIKGEMSGTVCVTFTWDIYMATPTGGEAARARAAKPPRVGLFRQHASCHSEMRKSFWGKIWGTRFGIICCVCDTNHCINKLNSPFYMFFKHKLDSVDAYMTIKPHFNRSTTTKTVSRVPVSCEISMWKSHLRETRLHLFSFLGGWLFHLKTRTHTT